MEGSGLDALKRQGCNYAHLNCRSIRGESRDKLAARLHGIQIDALTISESWLDERDITGMLDIENYVYTC